MLHTMQVRVVTRQLPDHAVVVHKAYYFCPSLLSAQGVQDLDAHIQEKIETDLKKFKEQFVEFNRATFKVLSPDDVPTVYIC